MSALTGFVAGVAVVVGGVSLFRYAEKRFRRFSGPPASGKAEQDRRDGVIEFERDPASGAYRFPGEASDRGR